MKQAFKIKRLKLSFSHAIDGFVKSVKYEHNLKLHIFVSILVIIFGMLLKVSRIEWIMLIAMIGLVIGAELLNTAIEELIDLNCKEFNHKAKRVKDIYAAYVMVLSITAAIVGLIIFIPRIIEMFR